jgi:hypothetical protein
MAETSLSIKGKPARRMNDAYMAPVLLPGHVSLHLDAWNETAPRDCEQPIATRHRGDASTSRTTEPVSRSCRAFGVTNSCRLEPRGVLTTPAK